MIQPKGNVVSRVLGWHSRRFWHSRSYLVWRLFIKATTSTPTRALRTTFPLGIGGQKMAEHEPKVLRPKALGRFQMQCPEQSFLGKSGESVSRRMWFFCPTCRARTF